MNISRKAYLQSLKYFQTNITKEWWNLNGDNFESSEDFPLENDAQENDDTVAQAMIINTLFCLSAGISKKDMLYLLGVEKFGSSTHCNEVTKRYEIKITFDHRQARTFDSYDCFFKFYGTNKGRYKRNNELFLDLEKAAILLARNIVNKVSKNYKDLSSLIINLAIKNEINTEITEVLGNTAKASDNDEFADIVFNKIMM